MEKQGQAVIGVLAGLLLANFWAWAAVFEFSAGRPLEVIFFDVGQGDAIFIETPQSHQVLIDGGPSRKILEKLSREMPFWDRTIDVLVLTHPNQDHWQGLLEVLKRYRVSYIIWSGAINPISLYPEWLRLIEEEGARVLIIKKPQRLRLQKELYLEVFSPGGDVEGQEVKNINDASLVSRLVFAKTLFLFTGDISSRVEKELVAQDLDLRSEVLQIAHHGSKYSSATEFLAAVSPHLAIISVGKNRYGHPAEEVLQRLRGLAIDLLRTDEEGDIKIISDGESLQVKTGQ